MAVLCGHFLLSVQLAKLSYLAWGLISSSGTITRAKWVPPISTCDWSWEAGELVGWTDEEMFSFSSIFWDLASALPWPKSAFPFRLLLMLLPFLSSLSCIRDRYSPLTPNLHPPSPFRCPMYAFVDTSDYYFAWKSVLNPSLSDAQIQPLYCIYIYIYFFNLNLFIFIFGCVGLRFCARAFCSCGKRGPLFIAVRGPLTIAAPPAAERRLQTRRLSNCGSRA